MQLRRPGRLIFLIENIYIAKKPQSATRLLFIPIYLYCKPYTHVCGGGRTGDAFILVSIKIIIYRTQKGYYIRRFTKKKITSSKNIFIFYKLALAFNLSSSLMLNININNRPICIKIHHVYTRPEFIIEVLKFKQFSLYTYTRMCT